MQKVVLIGFSACYKTTVGALLAQKLGVIHVDTDCAVAQTANATVAQIFEIQGEREFRRLENDLLKQLVNTDNVVVSCGGGTVLCPQFANFAKNAQVVWLTATVGAIHSRLGSEDRPLADGKSVDELQALLNARAPLYQQYATLTVATDDLSGQQVADLVLDALCATQNGCK